MLLIKAHERNHGDGAVQAIKEVLWPSATAALPRNTGTSITTPASKADRLRETTGNAPLGPDRRFHGVAGAACTQQRRWRLRSFRRQPEPCSDLMRAVFASTLPGIDGTAPERRVPPASPQTMARQPNLHWNYSIPTIH